MQYFFYFYSAISAVALVVHLIINWRKLVGWRSVKANSGAWEYRNFLLSLSLFFVSDVLWGLFAEMKLSRPLFIDTSIYFLAMALSLYTWTRYVVTYLQMDGWSRKCLLWSGRGLLAFYIIATVGNFFTNILFSIDAESTYTAGPLRHAGHIMLIAFNALSVWFTLTKLRSTDGATYRHNKMVFAFGVTMLAAIFMQLMNPYLPMYAIGCLLGCCFLHVFLFEDERDEMHQKEILAHEYKAKLEYEQEANKAKSLFFSTVSHDIRTPLNAIIGFSELLENGALDAKERERYVSSIRSSGKVLARLVDDILDLSRLECGKIEVVKEPTDVPALIHEVVAACEVARARKSLILKSEISEMPCVIVDPHRIRQILFNLLSNAYKYTERGTITVRVAWQDGTLTLAVKDTGKGIAKENISVILQPFVQVADKNHRDGTGLGLPICQKLATLMGGELTIESEIGVGSTFTITLRNVETVRPLARRTEGSDQSGQAANSVRLPSKVLVVDDSPINCEVLKALLEECGVKDVAMAANGREALEVLKGDPTFDMVLSDLWMPEMDGYGLVQAIRADAKFSRLPVYLLTADVEARNQAASNGFDGVLLKPVTLKKVQSLIS